VSTFLLIHGGWHGAWQWYKVVPLLTAAGHTVVTPDLPAQGVDRTPAANVTFEMCMDQLCALIDAQDEPVILVGHSSAGFLITHAADRRPDRIRAAVYLSGFVPVDGEALLDVDPLEGSLVGPNLELSADGSALIFNPDGARAAFYGDCSDEDVALAVRLLVPQPNGPFAAPQRLVLGDSDRLRRVYIECLQDRGLAPAKQQWLYRRVPFERVISMNTSHSPFLSAPEELAAHLSSL
jgi:pimeloyl-ACP methyl ester carboxylesterase